VRRNAALLQTGASPDVIEAKTERHWKVMARAILDGFPVGQLQQQFPTAANLVKHAERSHHNQLAGRLAAGNAMALELGWRLFEAFLRSATGTENVSATELRHAINSGIETTASCPRKAVRDVGLPCGTQRR
jgi:hypothetical protein